LTDHLRADKHSNPHDHLIKWDNNYPDFYDDVQYFNTAVPSFTDFIKLYFNQIVDFMIGDEKAMKNYDYNPDDYKFETLGEFKIYLSCGANVSFEFNNIEYSVEAVFGKDGKGGKKQENCYYIWRNSDIIADRITLEEVLDFKLDGVKIRDLILTAEITERLA